MMEVLRERERERERDVYVYKYLCVYTYIHIHFCVCVHTERGLIKELRIFDLRCNHFINFHIFLFLLRERARALLSPCKRLKLVFGGKSRQNFPKFTHKFVKVFKKICIFFHALFKNMFFFKKNIILERERERDICIYTYTYIYIKICIYIYIYICIHTHSLSLSLSLSHTHTHTRTHSHTLTHTLTHSHSHSHTHSHTHTHTGFAAESGAARPRVTHGCHSAGKTHWAKLNYYM
jgi:hypothetical protein